VSCKMYNPQKPTKWIGTELNVVSLFFSKKHYRKYVVNVILGLPCIIVNYGNSAVKSAKNMDFCEEALKFYWIGKG